MLQPSHLRFLFIPRPFPPSLILPTLAFVLCSEDLLKPHTLLLGPRNTGANHTGELLLANAEQHGDATGHQTHEDNRGGGNQPERRADVDLLAVGPAPVDVLAVLLVGELLGAEAAAHEALLVTLARLLARHGELVHAGSVAGAVAGRGDAGVLAGEAAQVHLVTLGGSTRGEAEINAAAARGHGDLVDLGVGEWALV